MQYNAKDYKSLQNLLIGRECAASVLLEIGSIGQFQLNTLQFFFLHIPSGKHKHKQIRVHNQR